jgi:hypothetical protein
VFLDRPGGPGGGWGHVARFVEDHGDGTFTAVGANEAPPAGAPAGDRADRWRLTRRRYADPLLRGFGSFDLGAAKDAAAKPLREEVLAALATSRAEWLGRERPELA